VNGRFGLWVLSMSSNTGHLVIVIVCEIRNIDYTRRSNSRRSQGISIIRFDTEKLECELEPMWCGYPIVKRIWVHDYSFRYNTRTRQTAIRTDRQTDTAHDGPVAAIYACHWGTRQGVTSSPRSCKLLCIFRA